MTDGAIARCAATLLIAISCSEPQSSGSVDGAGGAQPEVVQRVSRGNHDAVALGHDSEATAGAFGLSDDEAQGGARSTDVSFNTGGSAASGGAVATSGMPDHPMGGEGVATGGLGWPIDCVPFETCEKLGWPDIDDDDVAYDCGEPGYRGHQGTDIGITWEQMDAGVLVRAAADGVVFFAADGKYDRCPNENEPDCIVPEHYEPGDQTGTNVCTESGPYCGSGGGSCYWCFAGGNVIVILHENTPGVFATRYDHLKRGSVLVKPGDVVREGDVIALVGSAGSSTRPHLHFEVWGTGYYELADPWVGPCGPSQGPSLWRNDPPWQQPSVR